MREESQILIRNYIKRGLLNKSKKAIYTFNRSANKALHFYFNLVVSKTLVNMTEDFSLKALVLGTIRLTLRLKVGCF